MKLINTEQLILEFLVEMFSEKDRQINLLWEIVYSSRNNYEIKIASSNAITLLNCIGISFYRKDLNGIKICGADLSYAMMDSVNFEGADLTDVSMRETYLVNANLKNSIMKNVKLFERPSLLGHKNQVLCYFFFKINKYNKVKKNEKYRFTIFLSLQMVKLLFLQVINV